MNFHHIQLYRKGTPSRHREMVRIHRQSFFDSFEKNKQNFVKRKLSAHPGSRARLEKSIAQIDCYKNSSDQKYVLIFSYIYQQFIY